MKKQILIIDGGNCFNSHEEYVQSLSEMKFDINRIDTSRKKWSWGLYEKLGKIFDVYRTKMPCDNNAKYSEWKIYFEKIVPFLKDEVVLIGHSLGGIFLSKYLSENDFPVSIGATFLIAPPFDEKDCDYSLGDFVLPESLKKFEDQCENIFIYFSKDDPVVPFTDLKKYMDALPSAKKVVFEDKGHFNMEEFPEIVEKIKEVVN
ncbi:MAG: alpha/beta hydrolase [Candidatus Moranbacteria bacterium]|nr:alpha/beta hydrolase [Candidatus Moranbacteria bacterium]